MWYRSLKQNMEDLKIHARMARFYSGITREPPEGLTAAVYDNNSSSGRDC